MDLYLLSSDPEALRVCQEAASEAAVHIHGPVLAASLTLDAATAAHSVVVTDAATFAEQIEEMPRLAAAGFLRCVVICPRDPAGEFAPGPVARGWQVMPRPTDAEMRSRLGDWLALDEKQRANESQAVRMREVSASLETVSQELSALKQQAGLLDRQREKLASVFEAQNMLSKLSQEINCLDLDEIITICVTKIPLLVNARYASFYMHNVEAGTLELKRHNHGYRIDDVVRVTDDNRSAMVRALRERRIVLVQDFDEYEKMHEESVERPNAKRYASKSALIAPMLAGDRVVAVLNLADKRSGGGFDESADLPPIEQISVLVGAAIRNWQLFQEVHMRARCDAMTGFMNHQTFFDELEKEVLRVRRYHGALSVMMIDVDYFKKINDTHGHQVGDRILAHVSKIIRLNVRDTDVPARYGGDEFAVILSQADVTRAKLVAERIRETVEAQTFAYEGKSVPLSLSIGVAQYRAGMTVLDFVNEADEGLYEAKTKGRNRVEALPLG